MRDYFVEDENPSERILEIKYDSQNDNDNKILTAINKLINEMQPTCFNCINYYRDGVFCGYSASMCKIHGCIEALDNPHYDTDGSKCPDYHRS